MTFENQRPTTKNIEEMLAKQQITELVQYERYARDYGLWDGMATCYTDDATIEISWYKGDIKGFLKASKPSPDAQTDSLPAHKLHETLVWLHGDKAMAVIVTTMTGRTPVQGKTMDNLIYVRLVYSLKKVAGEWKIYTMTPIYERDTLLPVTPADVKPVPGARDSYKNLAIVLKDLGVKASDDLPGLDQPKSVTKFMTQVNDWLNE
ncbi:nuclear transport factor 2 family protein [Loigolactobacillus iwatensis]|uniref:nuclear transport factor 2 family protein n=1 Tax=Loigolactobacillus iwatensis TaxID=1267156 RepID=UPI000F7EE93A|nr:nuclear transport factor 2 family protein [Loigolactobacillus iwatensis]